MNKEFYSNGKLLLTGEYAVLDGTLSLAIPTTFGQSLKVNEIEAPQLVWKSRDEKGIIWFESVLEIEHLFTANVKSSENPIAATLKKILCEAKKINPAFLSEKKGYEIETILDFPRDWGLGSSSTLINNIAQWAQIDAYELLRTTFLGSGYDIACAQHDHPIVYRLANGQPIVTEVNFKPSFRDNLFFIHLNKKQDSREGIARYRKIADDSRQLIEEITGITHKVLDCKTLPEFEALLTKHETLLSKVLQIPTIKKALFPNFRGAVKSLGAWGGDFVLATGDEETPKYFKERGYGTVLPYPKMVL